MSADPASHTCSGSPTPKRPELQHHDGPSSPPEAVNTARKHREAISTADVRSCDVLLGRGKSIHCHAGNVVYRKDIKIRSRLYKAKEDQMEKEEIALEVIQTVLDRGGRFLRPIDDTSDWETCPPSVVRKKVKQALRDFVKERRSLNEKRTQASSESVVPQSHLLLQPESISPATAAAAAAPPPIPSIPARREAALAPSQLSISDELSALLESSRQLTSGMPSTVFAGVTQPTDLVAAVLLQQQQQQQASSITIPPTHLLPGAQLSMNQFSSVPSATTSNQLYPPNTVAELVSNLQQMLLQRGASSNIPLLHSYAALLRTPQQQPQRLLPGPLSHLQQSEIEELLRRLRQGGGGP